MKHISNPTLHRRGATTVTLVLTMVIIGLVIVGLVLGGARDQSVTTHRMTAVRGFYAAEAGMNMALREAYAGVDYDGDGVIGGITSTSSSSNNLSGASHNVAASKSGRTYSLSSLGVLDLSRFRIQSQVTEPVAYLYNKGVAVQSGIDMSHTARIDAFDSASGVYDPTLNYTGAAAVATNSTTAGGVKMANSATINGDLDTGVGSNPNSVLTTSGSAVVSGNTGSLDEPAPTGTINPPNPLPNSSGNLTLNGNSTTNRSTGIYRYANVTISNNHVLTITGDVTIYCNSDFTMSNTTRIRLNTGATLKIYAQRFLFDNGVQVNLPSSPTAPDPSLVTLYQSGNNDFTITNASIVIAVIIAPNARVVMDNGCRVFGVILANAFKMSNDAHFTQDYALTGGGPGSGSNVPTIFQWQQSSP